MAALALIEQTRANSWVHVCSTTAPCPHPQSQGLTDEVALGTTLVTLMVATFIVGLLTAAVGTCRSPAGLVEYVGGEVRM